jgi:hypothetical protein
MTKPETTSKAIPIPGIDSQRANTGERDVGSVTGNFHAQPSTGNLLNVRTASPAVISDAMLFTRMPSPSFFEKEMEKAGKNLLSRLETANKIIMEKSKTIEKQRGVIAKLEQGQETAKMEQQRTIADLEERLGGLEESSVNDRQTAGVIIDGKKLTITRLEQELKDAKEKTNKSEKQVTLLRNAAIFMSGEVEDHEAKWIASVGDFKDAQQESIETTERNVSLLEELMKSQQKVKEQQKRVGLYERRTSTLERQIRAFEVFPTDTQSQRKSMKSIRNDVLELDVKVAAGVDQLTHDLVRAQEECEIQQRSAEEWYEEAHKRQHENTALSQELLRTQKEVARLKSDLDRKDQRIGELENEVEFLHDNPARTQSSPEDSEQELETGTYRSQELSDAELLKGEMRREASQRFRVSPSTVRSVAPDGVPGTPSQRNSEEGNGTDTQVRLTAAAPVEYQLRQATLKGGEIPNSPPVSAARGSLSGRPRSNTPVQTPEVGESSGRSSASMELGSDYVRSPQYPRKRTGESLAEGDQRGSTRTRNIVSTANVGSRRDSRPAQEVFSIDIAQARLELYSTTVPMKLREPVTRYIRKLDEALSGWTKTSPGIHCLHSRMGKRPTRWFQANGAPDREHACRTCRAAGRSCMVMDTAERLRILPKGSYGY